MLPIHKELSKLDSNKTQMDYDATSFYPIAMWDENSVYPKIETGFAFIARYEGCLCRSNQQSNA